MIQCEKCMASNRDNARFCNECGAALLMFAAPKEPPTLKKEVLHKKRRADILFVLDCTGSMEGEIQAIKDSVTDFADTIASQGVRVRVGLIEFRDRLVHEEHRVLLFKGQVFTDDPAAFRSEVAVLQASGGGDAPESSLDALMLALRQPFAVDADKVIVLITDAPPHLPDAETKDIEEVLRTIRAQKLGQLYIVMRTQDKESLIYLRLLEAARGVVFELGTGDDFRTRAEHFKRTLMSLGKTISASTV
ncbi:MAG TPA: VWA domain-containing protein [Ktedonobacteraceae bacterium]